MKILLAEDEVGLSKAYAQVLIMQGYEVEQVYDGKAALEAANSGTYDLMIFDVMMPKMSGFEVLKALREAGNTTYVIMLTAMSELDDKVEGLELGADEYLTKPIPLKELVARIRSLERRMDTNYNENVLTFGSVKLNVSQQELSAKNSIILAGKETKLMEVLMLNKNKKLSTEYIYNHVWSKDDDSDAGYVWIYISYLKQKLKAINANVDILGEEDREFELVEV
ncbi:response regulator receiver domain / transcriptional regulatory protein, C-terminal domain multi-domain protein [Lachnoanaerobaculum saburreum F0468]|jgi:DNA-binding response regulator|uniref:Stage 0 sporulation protein A homolog n=1 Tax=Lachnoanaerobaculum saburreum F0468 TaxID=1095750 RepID=I0R599_9FIRM|nr:response regulator transcription factor [Lachnoanaerobaculum saburreum]EIC94857.1 response regulator receiver domain / transcriptional regulatory protein, C-terminal domain multi-domain protein [Lachnoanaerobaculum saburreum F0468]